MPRTITKTVTLYTFAELLAGVKDGTVKQHAVDTARDWLLEGVNDDSNWHEYVLDMWKQALAQIGFDDADISYSGFSSQGDGASFTCKRVDVTKLIEFLIEAEAIAPSDTVGSLAGDPKAEDFRPWLVKGCNGVPTIGAKFRRFAKVYEAGYVNLAIERTSHSYSHERTCGVSLELRTFKSKTAGLERMASELEEHVEQLRLDLSRAIYRGLEAEYEYLTSDEALEETAEANEYTFNVNGERED